MKTEKIEIVYRRVLEEELPTEGVKLVEAARRAAENAYAPYSKFSVGAAVELENSIIITGSNQENAAYPSGMCAERVAMFAANHQYPEIPPVAIAIAAFNDGKAVDYVSPCGGCRQVLLESETRYNRKIKVYMCGAKEIIIVESIATLLPFCFDGSQMK